MFHQCACAFLAYDGPGAMDIASPDGSNNNNSIVQSIKLQNATSSSSRTEDSDSDDDIPTISTGIYENLLIAITHTDMHTHLHNALAYTRACKHAYALVCDLL